MMRHDLCRLSGWIRGFALVGIAVLGLGVLVGSGGGFALGFPPCTGPYCDTGTPAPPVPAADVQPPYITALVGTPVTYRVETSNIVGSVSYQWRRSTDGGATYTDIAGATGSTYSLAGVNLGDDGAVFQVEVRAGNGVLLRALGRLVVSATPGLRFEDGEFQPADWVVSPLPDPGQIPFIHSEERVTRGGHPGAFRKMVFQVPPGAGSARLFQASLASVYDPAAQGAIRVIDYSEDCIELQVSETTSTESQLAIEQGGRRYVSNTAGACGRAAWSTAPGRSSLGAQDFRLFDGPACGAGESCPDFSAGAPPLRFGYWRISLGTAGNAIEHGIDNWRVTVWRR